MMSGTATSTNATTPTISTPVDMISDIRNSQERRERAFGLRSVTHRDLERRHRAAIPFRIHGFDADPVAGSQPDADGAVGGLERAEHPHGLTVELHLDETLTI